MEPKSKRSSVTVLRVIVIGTGKGTSREGTNVSPWCRWRVLQRKLVIPIFVRPSFERHEVDKRRHYYALSVVERFDNADNLTHSKLWTIKGYADTLSTGSIRRVGVDQPADRVVGSRGLLLRAVGPVGSRSVGPLDAVCWGVAGSAH